MPIHGSLSLIPSLYDRADGGVTNDLGTYTPQQLVALNYSLGLDASGKTTLFEEASDSPTVEAAEQWTITHRFYVDYQTGISLQKQYYRGYVMTDRLNNLSRVLSTTLVPLAKTNVQVCMLTVVSEGTNWGAPPDDFSVNIVELNPVAEKMPRYSALTYLQRNTIRNVQVADYTTAQQMTNLVQTFPTNVVPLLDQRSQALELMLKKQKGEESFYLSGFQIQYSRYFWIPQILNPGGYIQDPFLSGAIPSYFWNGLDANNNLVNIFSQVAQFNQNIYPNYNSLTAPPYGLSWLRQTDTVTLNRTWWRLTNTWTGAPLGHWDQQWYSQAWQPYQVSIYDGGINVISS
jgi:hypothetical protein